MSGVDRNTGISPSEPAARSFLIAVAGVAGGWLLGVVGGWLASQLVGPLDVGTEPEDLFANAILVLGPLLAYGLGLAIGYVAGAIAGPVLMVAVLGWGTVGRTALWLIVIEALVIPVAIGIITASVSLFDAAEFGLVLSAVVVGALTPAAARMIATRPLAST